MDPLAGSQWSAPGTVAGFAKSAPNAVLMKFAEKQLRRAAITRTREDRLDDHLHLVLAPMENIPARDCSFDLVIAHGIWNLARSAAQFRQALGEAARVAKPGAGSFVFTFSRNTFPPETAPVAGEPFVFSEMFGEPP